MKKSLNSSPIFDRLTIEEVEKLLEGRSTTRNYSKGEVIALQGEACNSLMIVKEGIVRGEMSSSGGETVVIEEIEAPRAIAPAILFATKNRFPVNVISTTDSQIVIISRDNFTAIMQSNKQVLNNFITSVADRGTFLAERVRLMKFGTIRSKLAAYLLEAMNREGKSFEIAHTQQELADMFGVTRPALSRAIAKIVESGAISSHRNHFTIEKGDELRRMADEI